jgi:hypothetical protein
MASNTKIIVSLIVVAAAGTGAYFWMHQKLTSAPGTAPAAAPVTAPIATPAAAPAAPVSQPTAASAAVAADCLLPGPAPVAPFGESASVADMSLAHDVIQNYVVELEFYQKCRDNQADHAPANASADQKQAWIAQGDSAVDMATAAADGFTAQLKVFKATHPGS